MDRDELERRVEEEAHRAWMRWPGIHEESVTTLEWSQLTPDQKQDWMLAVRPLVELEEVIDGLERDLATARRESARHETDAQELLADLVKAREALAGLEGERDESTAMMRRYGVSLAEERARRVEADRVVAVLRATVQGLTEELVRVRAEGRRS